MNTDTQEKLVALDRQIREKQKEMQALLRESTDHQPLDGYTFRTPDGQIGLQDLFGDHDDLIVIHNMGVSCPYCTLWADGFIGLLPHLQDRASVVVCSPDSPTVQTEFAAGRGWPFRMISDTDRSFSTDMGYAFEKDGKSMMMPGFSTFHRDHDGTVSRVGHAPFGPGDAFNPVWHMFEMLKDGPDGWQPKFSYAEGAQV